VSHAAADARVAALQELLRERDIDAFVATRDASIAYLSGFWGMQLERLFAVVVPRLGQATILAPELDRDGIAAAASPALARALWPASSDGMGELLDLLGAAPRVAVEEDHLWYARGRALAGAGHEPVDGSAVLMELREAKDADEVTAIRRSCTVLAEEFEALFARLRPGAVEREVNAEIDHRLRRRGATDTHALILFGEHAADPHGSPGDRALAAGDVVCADVSAQLDGYWGDLTRSATAGPAGDWARAAWPVVVAAHAAAIDATRVGAGARDVDAAQRALVEDAPELGACLHGAGHAMGTEIHEPPFLVPRSTAVLRPGMVLTIEPGIYRSGVGGLRLEDDVLVTDAGPVVLSDALSAELHELPAS
jgi:Xaa-Pro dipeptidase